MTGAPTGLGRVAPRYRIVDDMNIGAADDQRVTDLPGQRAVVSGLPANVARALAELPHGGRAAVGR
jgi:hypothetical protein